MPRVFQTYQRTVLFIVVLVWSAPLFAQAAQPVPRTEEIPLSETIRRATMQELVRLVDEIEKTPKLQTPEVLKSLGIVAIRIAHFHDFSKPEYPQAYQLAQRCAYLALQRADEMSMRQEVDVLQVLSLPARKLSGLSLPANQEEWVQLRKKNLALWLHAWQRINKFKNLPRPNAFANLPVPYHSDPGVRELQAKMIKDNAEKLALLQKIADAQLTEEIWLREMEHYLAFAYAHAPVSLDELNRLMETAEMPQSSKTKILESVNQQINESNASPKPQDKTR